jgi:N-methylhydantoinase A
MHRQEYGHAFTDPIEVVNLRVTATGVRPKVERIPLIAGSMREALIGEGEGVFRVDGALTSLPTRHYERAPLPVGEDFEGPAIVFQRDTTVLVPPGWRACAQPSGNLILAR